jgi:hypothetical protein
MEAADDCIFQYGYLLEVVMEKAFKQQDMDEFEILENRVLVDQDNSSLQEQRGSDAQKNDSDR